MIRWHPEEELMHPVRFASLSQPAQTRVQSILAASRAKGLTVDLSKDGMSIILYDGRKREIVLETVPLTIIRDSDATQL